MIRRHLLPLLAFLSGCAGPGPQVDSTSTERLLAQPPPDWQLLYQMNNVETRISEFIPPGQSRGEWTSKLVFESHAKLVDADPIDLVLAEVQRQQEKCSFVQHFNVFSGMENNYPTSTRLVMCGENESTELGHIHLFKAIQGNEYLYVVRVQLRVEPFEPNRPEVDQRQVAAWSNYLKQVWVCDLEDADHACPDPAEQD